MDYEKLEKDLIEAKNRALLVGTFNSEDGGTCNFDSPVLIAERINRKKLEETCEKVGLRCWKWFSGHYVITGFQRGQANLHTRMAEAFEKELAANGWKTTMYYQCD